MSSAFLLSASSRQSKASFLESICGNIGSKPLKDKAHYCEWPRPRRREPEGVDGRPALTRRANLRGGDAQRKASQESSRETARANGALGLPGPWYDHELDQPGQFCGLAPLWQLRQVVAADQVKRVRAWEALRRNPGRYRWCRRRRRAGFPARRARTRFCPPMPGAAGANALGGRQEAALGLERRLRRRDKETAVARPSSSRAACATSRCPRCTGSNEPPNRPRRSVTAAASPPALSSRRPCFSSTA